MQMLTGPGFHDIVQPDLISIFNEQELELLISGLPEIDIDDWKAHSEYQNYSAASPQIQWYWRAVRSFDKEERAKLLQFITGTSKVPLNGFKELEGMNGHNRFSIHRDYGSAERLPSSHTCFNRKCLCPSGLGLSNRYCRARSPRVRQLRDAAQAAPHCHHGGQRVLWLRLSSAFDMHFRVHIHRGFGLLRPRHSSFLFGFASSARSQRTILSSGVACMRGRPADPCVLSAFGIPRCTISPWPSWPSDSHISLALADIARFLAAWFMWLGGPGGAAACRPPRLCLLSSVVRGRLLDVRGQATRHVGSANRVIIQCLPCAFRAMCDVTTEIFNDYDAITLRFETSPIPLIIH